MPTPICFPRIRGDVPETIMFEQFKQLFSPHTRGCSLWPSLQPPSATVFPAYAGMFLNQLSEKELALRFPRIRGDVPRRGHRI